ncbi:MAG TPA: Flp family type IVb pilin [Propionibacteriaceae bacterium]|nr:Flp family type IVb pilin [Propionibacteriaceae bacterium]
MTALSAYITTLMFTLNQKFDDRQKGATAVEYGLMVSLIAVVIIVAVRLVGTNLTAIFNNIAGSL